MLLKKLTYKQSGDKDGFPFNLPLIKSLSSIEFDAPVTILVGENGTGKSTFLEALACATNAITVGNQSVNLDNELESARKLSRCFQLTWSKKTNKGFFLRAEDFIGYTKRLSEIKKELQKDLEDVDTTYASNSRYARELARLPYQRSLYELENQYSGDLAAKSHGESFLELFRSRFMPNALFILDEPETPLSPMNQFAFMVMIHEMQLQNAQFIIATHSPIIMAFPNATILDFNKLPVQRKNYEELEAVNFTRSFLNNKDEFLKRYF